MKKIISKIFNIENRYIPALSIVALFAILGLSNVKDIVNSIQNEGKLINISGRQRMLSQKLILLAQRYVDKKTPDTKKELLSTIKLMDNSHTYLMKNTSKEIIQELYYKNNLNTELNDYLSQLKNISDTKNIDILSQVQIKSENLLEKLDFVVNVYEIQYKRKMIILQQKGEYLFFGIIFVLILEWIFIFRPASQKIKRNTDYLEKMIQNKINELQKSIDIISENVIYSQTDIKGYITYASKAFCKISGYTNEELLGQPHNIIRHMDMPKEAFKNMWDTIQSGKNWYGEVKNLKKDGSFYWVEAHISPEYNSQGELIGYAAVRQDITHKKAIEELNKELEERIDFEVRKNREKDAQIYEQSKLASMGEMIGNIAHQWRQPLSVISTSATGLMMQNEYGLLDDAKLNKACENINTNAQYLSKTIDDFRDFIKDDKQFKQFKITDIIHGSLNILDSSLHNSYINIILDINDDIKINGSKNELEQAIINIINNAKDVLVEKVIEEERALFISTKKIDNNTLELLICDNAGGIPEEIITKIFEPYFTTKHQSQGTGLGLSMAHSIIVGRHKQTLLAHNVQVAYNGKNFDGACFKIIFSLPN